MDIVTNFIEICINYLSILGPLFGFSIVVLESFIPPLPLGVFVALNCNAFGIISGILISYLATILGCLLSYFIFNKLSNKVIIRNLSDKNKERVTNGAQRIKQLSFSSLVLLIALPFTPAFLINIIAGVSGISKRKFTLSLIIGKISTITFWGIIGKSFIESITDLKAIAFLIITLIIAYILSKLISKKMNIE